MCNYLIFYQRWKYLLEKLLLPKQNVIYPIYFLLDLRGLKFLKFQKVEKMIIFDFLYHKKYSLQKHNFKGKIDTCSAFHFVLFSDENGLETLVSFSFFLILALLCIKLESQVAHMITKVMLSKLITAYKTQCLVSDDTWESFA